MTLAIQTAIVMVVLLVIMLAMGVSKRKRAMSSKRTFPASRR